MGIRHILWTRAEATDSEQLKTNFMFAGPTAVKAARNHRSLVDDPLPPALCQHISDRLKANRFQVSEVWRGKPLGAGVHVRFIAFEIHYIVMAEPLPDKNYNYVALSWCSRPCWKRPSPEEVATCWQKVSDVVESVLGEDPQITSLRRMSRQRERETAVQL